MKEERQSLGTQKEAPDESSRAENNVDALHRATLSLFSDLSLDGVLRRIIHAARDLSGAQYAAIGIPDGKGGLEAFITLGMSDEETRQIPHLPVGHGLIGEMIRTGQSIRIPEIIEHPRSVGFPSGHPRMRSFLGVPIIAYGRNLGQIYLTDKRNADEFTPEDQRLIEMLAAHAAAAIENARLYRQVSESEAELTQRNLELELVNSLSTTTSSTSELDALLEVMLERLITIFGAGAGEFYLREETEGSFYKVLHRGEVIEALWEADRFRPGEGLVGQVAKDGKPLWTPNLTDEVTYLDPAVGDAGFGSMVCVPLNAPGQVVGVLCLAFQGERVIDEREISLLEAVGAGVGIAVENARLNRRTRRLAVLEERERIGMDLHDGIIQSVYAVGLTLEYIRLQIEEDPEQAIQRLEQAIEGLDAVIGDLRSYILDLQPSRIEVDDLHVALERLVGEFKSNTLVDAELITEPEALEKLERVTASELFLIAQEALANTAKHAFATKVWLSVRQLDEEVFLQVIDNGRGFDLNKEPERLGHGLSNMSERARQIGGRFEIVSNPGDGTTVTVRMPMNQDSHASQSPSSSTSVSAHIN
ncbi:MAG: GAF domain-containing sensor histidine kinase [Anaerolineaceae bacterium]|nr:MAG: GAF domain-containing sensor histidine kinase [Anaerolineaceae bacterium]